MEQLTFGGISKAAPKAKPRDPFTADSSKEFSKLFQEKHGRYPDAMDQNEFWEQRPEIFELENGESLRMAARRIKA